MSTDSMELASLRVDASRRALIENQSAGGAFVASPDFSQYPYCWLRDGAFTAYAADATGLPDVASAFHEWATRAILGIRGSIEQATAAHREGGVPDGAALPPARFSLDGRVVDDDWPNFQIDGYGFWLWAFGHHLALTGASASPDATEAVRLTAAYLEEMADEPCFDVWEMFSTAVHTSTLAGAAAGLRAAAEMLGERRWAVRSAELIERIRLMGGTRGRLVKSTESDQVDASTLWVAYPLALIPVEDPLMAETLLQVERDLSFEGGIRRFPDDTYFGGGAWPVLTATAAGCRLAAGDRDAAGRYLEWIEERFDGDRLGEQFGGEVVDEPMFEEWVQTWGPPAQRLVWSHAMHLLLAAALGDRAAPPDAGTGFSGGSGPPTDQPPGAWTHREFLDEIAPSSSRPENKLREKGNP